MITAKIICRSKNVSGEGENAQAALSFEPDYKDDRNQDWARYTPALSLNMTVKGSVGEAFEVGDAYTLQFVKDESR